MTLSLGKQLIGVLHFKTFPHLGDDPIEVCVRRPVHLKVLLADLVDGLQIKRLDNESANLIKNLVVHEETDINGFEAGVGRQDRIVGFHNGWCHLSQMKVQLYFHIFICLL